MKINILTSAGSGFGQFARELMQEFCQSGHAGRIYGDHAEMERGDLLFILSYFKILPESALKLHSNNIVVHASDLPAGKGFSPVAWQIVEGRHKFTFSLIEAVRKLDAGPVYMRSEMQLDGTELFEEWKQLQNEKVVEMVQRFVREFPEVIESGKAQQGVETIYRRRTSMDDMIDPEQSLASQFDAIRVCHPDQYPAWFEFRGRKYRLRIDALDES